MDIYVGNITAKIIEHNDLDTNADRVGPLLEHLDVSRNRLTKLPSSLGELTSCTTVLAEFNQIKAVPLLTSCVSLTTLSLDGNSLQKGLPYQRDLKGILARACEPILKQTNASTSHPRFPRGVARTCSQQQNPQSTHMSKTLLVEKVHYVSDAFRECRIDLHKTRPAQIST